MDTVGHEATRHPTESHRKEDGKVVEKEMIHADAVRCKGIEDEFPITALK